MVNSEDIFHAENDAIDSFFLTIQFHAVNDRSFHITAHGNTN